MTTQVLSLPIFRAFDSAGLPLAGGLLYTYAAGTTTPLATYSSSDTSTPNANPVVLDSSGTAVVRTTTAAYKFVLKDATGTNTLWSVDNWQGNYLSQSDIISLLGADPIQRQTAAEIAAGVTPTNYGYPPGDVRRYSTLQQAHDALPSTGGMITLPYGTTNFAGLVVNRPIILQGQGAGIGVGNVSPTKLNYTGSGIAIDLQDGGSGLGARGSVLRDFQLVNGGTGTIGIRINSQDPKIQNVYIYQTTSGTAGFSLAGIRVGDVNQVNDLLLRDVYLREQPALGIDLWNVSEGTLDHVRMIWCGTYQLKIGDAGSGSTVNGLNCVNGTSPQTGNASGSGGVLIQRSAFKLVFDHCQFETDSVNGAAYAIDARTATTCDAIIVKNSYFYGASWTTAAAYAISVGYSGIYLETDGCYFLNFATSAINNVSAASISFGPGNVYSTCPLQVDTFTSAVQQYTGTFTPTALGSSTAGATTYTVQTGTFSRNGHVVEFKLHVAWSAATGTGNLVVGNLPLTSANTDLTPVAVIVDSLTFANQVSAAVIANASYAQLYTFASGGAKALVSMQASGGVYLTGTYFV